MLQISANTENGTWTYDSRLANTYPLRKRIIAWAIAFVSTVIGLGLTALTLLAVAGLVVLSVGFIVGTVVSILPLLVLLFLLVVMSRAVSGK